MPVVDMYETSDDLILDFELPGIREKEISLSIIADVLTLKGERWPGDPRLEVAETRVVVAAR